MTCMWQKIPNSRGNNQSCPRCARPWFGVQPHKAPGLDDIPAIVWKELWPILGRWIFLLFEASLRTGIIPQSGGLIDG